MSTARYFVQRGHVSGSRHYGTDHEVVPASDYDALLARCEAAETRLRAGTPSPDESNRHTVIEEIAAERRRQLGVLATDWRIGNAKHTDEV
jgi:hypothetical protein